MAKKVIKLLIIIQLSQLHDTVYRFSFLNPSSSTLSLANKVDENCMCSFLWQQPCNLPFLKVFISII